MSADLLSRLIAAGTDASLVAEVALLIARAETASEAIEVRRSKDRERQSRRRHAMSRDITLNSVTARDVTDVPAPSPSPLPSPCTPNQPHAPTPTRGKSRASTCEAARSTKALWPADMPPPADVSDDQWAGFIAHRAKARKPMTARAYTLLAASLAEHASDEWPPGAIVDEMTQRSWLTFKPEWLPRKSETRNGNRPHQNDRPRSRGLLGAVFDAEHADRAGFGF